MLFNCTNAVPIPEGMKARIGFVYYASLADAYAAAVDGDTIVMIDDDTLAAALSVAKSVTLDLNGFTVQQTTNHRIAVDAGGTLTVTDESDGGAGAIRGGKYSLGVRNGGRAVLEGGAIKGTASTTAALYIATNGGTITVEGGTVIGSTGNYAINNAGGSSSVLTVSGGMARGTITKGTNAVIRLTGGIYSARPNAAYVPSGYSVVSNTDPTTSADYPYAVVAS